jgi:hypothetical protein
MQRPTFVAKSTRTASRESVRSDLERLRSQGKVKVDKLAEMQRAAQSPAKR